MTFPMYLQSKKFLIYCKSANILFPSFLRQLQFAKDVMYNKHRKQLSILLCPRNKQVQKCVFISTHPLYLKFVKIPYNQICCPIMFNEIRYHYLVIFFMYKFLHFKIK